MPIPRVMTDQPWADVVVDLRANRSIPLPTRPFAGRRKVTVAGSTISGTRRATGDGPTVGIVKWTDDTGFTGAVVTMLDAGGEFAQMNTLLPHLAHLTSEHIPSKYKNVAVPQQRGEQAFATALPGLRQILTDGTITAPVPGSVNSRDALMYRLAWAAVGVTDLTTVPFMLRDWDRVSAVPGDGRDDDAVFPEDLTLRGPNLVAAWQRAGFDTAAVVGEWVERLYPTLDQAQNETSQRRATIEDLATWHAARFTPEDTLAWFPAARYDNNTFAARFVPADFCAGLRARGITAEHLSYLTRDIEERTAPSAAAQHVRTWLNVSPDPTRVCWYIAAGIGKAEARDMERSADKPTLDQLQLLAGLRTGADTPPVTLG